MFALFIVGRVFHAVKQVDRLRDPGQRLSDDGSIRCFEMHERAVGEVAPRTFGITCSAEDVETFTSKESVAVGTDETGGACNEYLHYLSPGN